MNFCILTEPAVTFGNRLFLEYLLYAAIIVIGIVLLLLLRKCGRLPKHDELYKKLSETEAAVRRFPESAKELSSFRYRRTLSKLVSRADKLLYFTAQMADKERDNDLNRASMLIESARDALRPYRYEKRGDLTADLAADIADKFLAAADAVKGTLARDAQLRAERAKTKAAKSKKN